MTSKNKKFLYFDYRQLSYFSKKNISSFCPCLCLCLFQGASALKALPLLLFERSRDHLVRGSSHAWRYSRVANTSN